MAGAVLDPTMVQKLTDIVGKRYEDRILQLEIVRREVWGMASNWSCNVTYRT